MMKILKSIALGASLLLATAGAEAATRYVRTDGGTSTQCTGLANAAYDGSGSGEACAWTLSTAFTSHTGGDTIIIKNGSYPINTALAAVKSGTASQYTVIQGEQAGACKAMPELWGANGRIRQGINLTGSNYVRVECLHLTDHDDCSTRQTGTPDCDATNDDYMEHGIYSDQASNLIFRDINIVGTGNGYKGARTANMEFTRVRMYAVSEAGFHGVVQDTAGNDVADFSGNMTFTDVEIAFAGCADMWPSKKVHLCVSQAGGGYGDAFGTYHTAGTWTFERVNIHHATQDGLDMRYTTVAGSSVIIRNSWFYGNAGNQVKAFTRLTLENSFVNSNCGYWGTRYGTGIEPCRADGNAIIVLPSNCTGVCTTIRYNTIAGESAALVQFASGGTNYAGYRARLENNIIVGDTKWNNSGLPATSSNSANTTIEWYNNIIWNSNGCPSGSRCINPQLVNINVPTFDPRPLYGVSPAIGTANRAYTTPLTDIIGVFRPTAPTVGAFEPMQP